MKSLRAYILLVLGLGMVFSVKANSDIVRACLQDGNYSTTDNPNVTLLYSYNLIKKPILNNNNSACEYFTEKKKRR